MQGYYYAILHNNQPTHYEDIKDHPHVVKERIKVCYSSLINVEANHPLCCLRELYIWRIPSFIAQWKGRHSTYYTTINQTDWRRLKVYASYTCIHRVYISMCIQNDICMLSHHLYIHIHVYKWEWHYWCIIWYNTIQRNMI